MEGDGGWGEGEIGLFVVVACGAEVAVLADGGARADGDGGDGVGVDVSAEGGELVHGEVPGGPDLDGGVDVDGGVELGAEEAEEHASPSPAERGGGSEEGEPDEAPKDAGDFVAEGEAGGLGRWGEVGHGGSLEGGEVGEWMSGQVVEWSSG